MKNKLTRISKDKYNKSDSDIQSKLTSEEIHILLKDYIEISDIEELKVGIHIRYYTYNLETNQKLFRMGGNIIKIDHNNKYIVLSNGNISWCVQIGNSIIYKKMNIEDIKNLYEEKLKIKRLDINNYKINIKNLESNYNKLCKEYKLLKDSYKKLFIKYKKLNN